MKRQIVFSVRSIVCFSVRGAKNKVDEEINCVVFVVVVLLFHLVRCFSWALSEEFCNQTSEWDGIEKVAPSWAHKFKLKRATYYHHRRRRLFGCLPERDLLLLCSHLLLLLLLACHADGEHNNNKCAAPKVSNGHSLLLKWTPRAMRTTTSGRRRTRKHNKVDGTSIRRNEKKGVRWRWRWKKREKFLECLCVCSIVGLLFLLIFSLSLSLFH